MDKVKKIFSPGSSKDDEVLYGDPAERRRESASKPHEPAEPETLRPVEGAEKKEHSILRQIVNPGGEKYDEQRFGTTATTESGDPSKLETHPESKKQHTITDQILNPGYEKYDPKLFEGTATTGGGDRRSSVRPEAPEMVGPDTKLETDQHEKEHQHSILRQIINPGGAKYDEEGYGTTAHAAGSLGNQPSDTKDHSIARQVLNPGHEKYDPVVHGGSGEPGPLAAGASSSSGLQQPTQPTAGAAASTTTADRSTGGMTLRSPELAMDDSASCLSVKSGVEGPFARGADTHGVGASNTTAGQGSIPGSQGTDFGRDAAIVGGGAAAAGAGVAAYSHDRPKHENPSTTTTTTTTSHHTAPLTDRSAAGASHTNPIGAPETTAPPASGSHLGRDAVVAGGAGLAGGAAYSQLNKPRDDVAAATYTERSQPLAGGAASTGSATPAAQQTGASTGSTGGFHVNPIGAPEESLEGQPRLGQDAAFTGGVGAAGGVAASEGVTQLNKAPADVQQATYTERAYPIGGPHQTETANKLDPHVPGEFPTATGEDQHGQNPTTLGGATAGGTTSETGAGSTTSDPAQEQEKQTLGSRISAGVAGIASAVGLSSNKDKEAESAAAYSSTSGTAAPVTSSNDYDAGTEKQGESAHHYGRDAAVVGGLGAAGAGAYAATRDRDAERPAESRLGGTQAGQTATGKTTTSYPSATQTTSTTTQPVSSAEKTSESHTGRDAALAGGAGAAGVGAYEASKDTGPASKTIGPHESNIANIVDPRVKPEPEKMKQSTTTGPHSSDMANKMDPRVEADPARSQEKEHHYGRDAAVAGAAGAAGAGTYAATRDDKTAGPHDPAVIAAQKAALKESDPSYDKHPAGPIHDKHDSKEKHQKHDKHDDETGEKKRGLLDKILHPGRKSEDKEGRRSEDHSGSSGGVAKTATDSDGHTKLHKKALGDPAQPPSGSVIEPHTGLPMNVEKYGDGAGGTDGARQIGGYHETDPAVRQASVGTATAGHHPGEEGVAGPDWDAIKKANTPY